MNQGGRLESVTRSLPGHFVRGQFPQFLIDQWKQGIGGCLIAARHGFENTGDVAHGEDSSRISTVCNAVGSTSWSEAVNMTGVKRTRMPGKESRHGNANTKAALAARRWARRLAARVDAVLRRHPDADPEDVRLTFICLQSPPLTRLNRSLRRGQGFAAFRS